LINILKKVLDGRTKLNKLFLLDSNCITVREWKETETSSGGLRVADANPAKKVGKMKRDEIRVEKNSEKFEIFNLTAQRRVNITLELSAMSLARKSSGIFFAL